MARLTYRKSIKVAPGVRLNVTHKGVRSISAGAKGLRLTQDLHGDVRGGGRTRTAVASARAPKPTAAEREAKLLAGMSPDQQARYRENKPVATLWIATIIALLISVPLPVSFLVSLPLLVVAIVKTVKLARSRRLTA